MKIENGFDVPLPVQQTWDVLLDIPRIAPCLPGAELLEKVGDDGYRGKVSLRLGPLAVTFVGLARFELIDRAANRATVRANGTEAKGRGGAQAKVDFSLAPTAQGGTRVGIVTDLTLNGMVAQYGRAAGVIGDISQQLIDKFAAALKAQIQAAGISAAPAGAPAAPEPQKPIAGFELLWRALWNRVQRLFGGGSSGGAPAAT